MSESAKEKWKLELVVLTVNTILKKIASKN